MHNVGADWLMTTLAPSPLMVSLMQTAENAPLFLLALPAGALADIVDRRRLLLYTQAWMLVSAVALGLLTLFGLTTPWVLLLLIFFLGLGSALNAPAWQAIMPELVPRSELSAAVSLNSVAFNIARGWSRAGRLCRRRGGFVGGLSVELVVVYRRALRHLSLAT
jgi:MFS family permease